MKISSAYAIGNKNKNRGRECQDYVVCYEDDQISIIAVADGASTAINGGWIAAKTSALFGVECMKLEEYWNEAKARRKENFFDMFADDISDVFDKCKHDINDLCSTLTVVAVKADGSYLIMSIGDGAVISYDDTLSPQILVRPYNIGGEKNRTIFTINRDQYLKEGILKTGNIYNEGIVGFAAISDGADYLIDYLYNGGLRLRMIAAAVLDDNGDEYVDELVNWLIDTDPKSDDTSVAIMMDDAAGVSELAKKVVGNPTYYDDEDNSAGEEKEGIIIPMDKISPMHQPIVMALCERSLTAEELVNEGYCLYGHVLETMRQLIEDGFVVQENGAFRLSDQILHG